MEQQNNANVHVIDCDAAPFVYDHWTVQEHKQSGQLEWNATKMKLCLIRGQQNEFIDGHQVRKELEGQMVMNANVLDYLLAHPELIPDEWKRKTIFFWGTIYRFAGDQLCVRSLCWSDGQWHGGGWWLTLNFNENNDLASLLIA